MEGQLLELEDGGDGIRDRRDTASQQESLEGTPAPPAGLSSGLLSQPSLVPGPRATPMSPPVKAKAGP